MTACREVVGNIDCRRIFTLLNAESIASSALIPAHGASPYLRLLAVKKYSMCTFPKVLHVKKLECTCRIMAAVGETRVTHEGNIRIFVVTRLDNPDFASSHFFGLRSVDCCTGAHWRAE
jgi:hypothetical protein